jgi:class 3 adenylate cyclase/TolB-like protein/Tfp pilus assembly protein PilF
MAKSSRKLAAILFSDIEDYSTLIGSHEGLGLEILKQSRDIQKPLVESHNGKWLKEMGDGVLAQFDSAVDAVKCALEIQKKAYSELEVKIRIGIHLGDVTVENEDVFGDGVNIASRIQSIADPGGIYISESVREAIHAQSDIISNYLGDVELKNVNRPIRIYSLEEEWLPVPDAAKIKSLTRSGSQSYLYLLGGFLALVLALYGWWNLNENTEEIKSIAILPVSNLSGDTTINLLMTGIHAELSDKIARIGGLRVVSRRSTMKYQNSGLSIAEIAQELKVDAIIEPDIFSYTDSVIMQVRLIRALPEEHQLWSESFERPAAQVISIYNNVALTIADLVNVKLTAFERTSFSATGDVNPEAHLDYLRGLFHWQRLSLEGFDTALKYFKSALVKDPDYAAAYAGIAMVWGGKLQMGLLPTYEAMAEGLEAADKALELDSSLSEVHYMLALYGWWEWDFEKADKEMQKTIEINPNFTDAYANYAHFLMAMGRTDDALHHSEKALSIEPANMNFLALHAMDLNNARRYDDAIDVINNAKQIDPDYPMLLSTLRTTYHLKKMYDEALEAWIQSFQIKNDSAAVQALHDGNEEGGYYTALSRVADLMVTRVEDSIYVSPWSIATLYTRANEGERALNWLDKAYKEHDVNMPYIACDPIFDNIQDQPRFQRLLVKMKLTRNLTH